MVARPRHLRSPAVPPLVALVLALGPGAACTRRPPAADPNHAARVEAWRAERLARLTSEGGWLTLVGIHWLKPGVNTFGSATDNGIVLRHSGVPAHAGSFELAEDGTVVAHVADDTTITLGGARVGELALRTDRSGRPDVLDLAGLRLHVIERSGALAVRVRDPESPRRRQFKGIPHYPVDPRFRVVAAFERYDAPRQVSVASAQGPPQAMLAPGVLRFTAGGRECTLEPTASPADATKLFIVFSDATAGDTTYGAGRFLDATLESAEATTVELDFNIAYNPPCAFSPYATCPLPAARNVLPVRIEAGEKDPAMH